MALPVMPTCPWLVSMAMWVHCMRFVPEDGITTQELARRARLTATSAPMILKRMGRWWGYLRVERAGADGSSGLSSLGKSRIQARRHTLSLRARFTASAAWLAVTVMAHNLAPAVGILVAGLLRRATAATLQRVVLTAPRAARALRAFVVSATTARLALGRAHRAPPRRFQHNPRPPLNNQPPRPPRPGPRISRQTGNSTLPLSTGRPPQMNDMQGSLKQSIRQCTRAD